MVIPIFSMNIFIKLFIKATLTRRVVLSRLINSLIKIITLLLPLPGMI